MSGAFPEILHVRSEETPALAGAYRQVPSRAEWVNEYPVWIRDGGGGWLYSSKEGCWQLADEHGDLKEDICVYCSCSHLGRSPSTIPHLSWSNYFRPDDDIILRKLEAECGILDCPTGFAISEAEEPKLPQWAEGLWLLRKRSAAFSKVSMQQACAECIDALEAAFVSDLQRASSDSAATLQTTQGSLDACITGCVAAFVPDLDIIVGSTRISANRKLLVESSSFFAAMLSQDLEMKEASSKCVTLPSADITVVRQLFSLIYSGGAAITQLNLSFSELVDVLAQAAEWQCDSLLSELLAHTAGRLNIADAPSAVRFLKLAMLHAEDSKLTAWQQSSLQAIERVAETCAGDLASLHDLPYSTLRRVLESNKLDTGDKEGCVLTFVVEWVRRKEERIIYLPQLLKIVRFPLLNLAALSESESAAMRFAHDNAGKELEILVGEAVAVQIGPKKSRPRSPRSSADPEADIRSQKRQRGSSIPTVDHHELGKLLCRSFSPV